jgi:hypothetical protein
VDSIGTEGHKKSGNVSGEMTVSGSHSKGCPVFCCVGGKVGVKLPSDPSLQWPQLCSSSDATCPSNIALDDERKKKKKPCLGLPPAFMNCDGLFLSV